MILLSFKRTALAFALSLLSTVALAQTGGLTIDKLQPAGALSGNERFPVWQGTNPARAATAQQIKTYVFSSGPAGVAGGDLCGTYPSPTVCKMQSNAVSAASPSNGQCMVYVGSPPAGSWGPGSCAGATGVSSFNARIGAVIPTSGDYSFSLLTGTVGCAQVASFTGDATNVACAMTIANGAVTNAKMAAGAAALNLALGTGVGTALQQNIGAAGAPVLFNGAGGTPSAIALANGTGLPIAGIASLGTNVATGLATATGTANGFPRIIAGGTIALGTSAITAGTCGTAATATATGTATTDDIDAGFNGDPTAVTGYTPTAMLTLVVYPTTNTVNVKQCNLTAGSITPSALTLNFWVRR